MSTMHPTAVDVDLAVVEGVHIPAGLSAARAELWTVERGLWGPRTVQSRRGAALTAGRPHTAYRKIVDVVADDIETFRRLIGAAADDVPPNPDGSRPAPIVVRFEEHPNRVPLTDRQREVLGELGFVEDPVPVPSVESTRPDSLNFARGWSKWFSPLPTERMAYYGQTTDVTCGPTTALMAMERAGFGRLGADGADNHAAEIALWRKATNAPGCDPVSLALAVADEITAAGLPIQQPTAVLSAPGLILVEDFAKTPEEAKLRKALQLDSLRRADAVGLPIERRWFTVDEVGAIVSGGADVFLLIALEPLIADPSPHWVLVHDVIDDVFIVSDPWVESEHGESWVDSAELPIPSAGIDLIARLGEPVVRGMVIFGR